MAQSYYKTIHGVRYDRSLLEAADERIAGQGDGRISEQDAKELVELSKDGGRVTETELRTLKHIRENYRFTPKAAAWFAGQLPAIEQAVHPDQLAQPEPPRPTPPPTQTPPPPPKQLPPAPQPWPEEASATETSSNSPIPHVIWGVLLLASIIIGVIFYQGAAEQVNSLEAKLATAPDTQQLEQQVADLQAERTALQTQITDLNQQVAKTESDHSELEKRFSTTQNRLESADTEIVDLQSKAQALLEQVTQAEQATRTAQAAQAAQVAQAEKTEPVSQPQPVKISEASSVSEVLRVLQENALVHADVFKITALKLDASLEGFKFNEAILLPGHKELLNRLIPLLKPLEVQLKLIGHTDSTGNYSAVNLFLSHRRALVASQYITEKLDFPRERVYVTGRAHLKPTVENTSIPMRMKNRRVDLHLEIHNGHALEKLP